MANCLCFGHGVSGKERDWSYEMGYTHILGEIKSGSFAEIV